MHEVPPTSSLAVTPRSLTPSPGTTRIIVLALLAVIAVLLYASVRQESQTFDESDHLFAGLEYWRHGDFGRNPEHPPLVKLLASIPLLPMGLREPPLVPFPFFKAQDFINASQLLYTANADAILLRGRLVVGLISLMFAVLVFVAAREMFNPLTAILALGIFAFEPVLLANGALVTTDVPLACLFFASIYSFYRYVKSPTLARLALCAAATALAIASKHSGILLLPILVLLALAESRMTSSQSPSENTSARQDRRHRFRTLIFAVVAISFFSYVALWGIYGFRYAARPGQLQMIPTLAGYSAGLIHSSQQTVIAFMARHHLLPEAYLYGWVDILLIPGTRSTFLFGHYYSSGQWFYFPGVFLIKTTLTLLILLVLVPFAGIRERRREFLFLTLPVAFYLLVAIPSLLNLGIRHILPIYPFCILLAGAAAASFASRSISGRIAVAALLLVTVISSLHSFPDFLAYSNELVGGPSHTYRIVTDSNADWGQGLKWTKTYLDQHPTSDCWFDYSNPMVDPGYYGIRCKPLLSGMGHLIGFGPAPIPSTISGTFLISATEASGLLWGPDILNPYEAFLLRPPDARIGNVILVYRGTFDLPLLAAQTNALAANNLLRGHRLPEAVALAQTAVQQAPNSAQANAVLGQTLLASGRIAEGQQAIGTALHLAQTIHPDAQKYLVQQLQLSKGGS